MWRLLVLVLAGGLCSAVFAAEHVFDFNRVPLNETPPGFRSTLTGLGQPGEWKIILDEAPSPMAEITAQASRREKKPVLAQLSQDSTDEHFPLLIYDEMEFGDFTFTTKFKTVEGKVAQMAGIAFRIQDEENYYYARASTLGNTFRFFKVVNGVRGPAIGPDVEIPAGVWHELGIECRGNRISLLLNGEEIIPPLTDNSFNSGKIGFWTKSDAVSYFTDAKIVYSERESLAERLVREAVERFPRLLDLRIYTLSPGNDSEPRVVASMHPDDIGQSGTRTERDVIRFNSIFFGRNRANRSVTVTMPLRDRNGETIAAVRVVMRSFLGQTESNALGRAQPIIKQMEQRTRTARDLLP